MPAKQLRFDTEARQLLRHGVDAVADAVAVTLGPRGRSVVLDKKFGAPLITTDGVTIARDLDFKDHFENMGAQLLREVAVKTNDIAGDGTTTATVLSRAMIDEGLRLLSAGAFPVELRQGMLAAAAAAAGAVRARSHPVDTNEDIRRVATISADDAEIGEMLADAFAKVGKEGVVTVESADGIETTVEVVEGMQLDRGYVSAYLVTDQKEMVAELEHPAILISDAKISAVRDLLPVLELVAGAKRPLLIVAEDVTAEALATLVVNRMRGTLTAVAIKAPGFGDRRKAMLQDLAALTGATVVSEEVGIRLDAVTARQLGSADRVTVTKDDTTVVGGGGDRKAIDARCEEIRQQIEETEFRLGPGEAAGAAGPAGRRGCPDQGRGGHRGGDEGAQGACRRRSPRDPRRPRGGLRRGWGCRPDPGPRCHRRAQVGRRRSRRSARRPPGTLRTTQADRGQCRAGGRGGGQRGRRAERG